MNEYMSIADRMYVWDKQTEQLEGEMAKEYAKLNARQYNHNDGIGFCTSEEEVEKAYNAGFKEALKMKVNTTTVSDAPLRENNNEWHYPTKDNQFPFFGRPCLCIDFNDNIGIAYLREDGVWTTDGKNAFESIKCWQYVKLPELKESEE